MAGTKAGGMKAVVTNKAKHGDDFYRRIGQLGGSVSSDGGFASDCVGKDGLTGRQRARLAGQNTAKKRWGWHNTEKVVRNGEEVIKINVKYIPSH